MKFKKFFQSKKKPTITKEQALREGGYTREDSSNLSPDGRILLNGPAVLGAQTIRKILFTSHQ